MSPAQQIEAMVHRETAAWNAYDAEALVDLFHPDTVWPWPPNRHAHNPADWVMPLGRFDRNRWKASWQSLFDSFELVSNNRTIAKIEVSAQGDGGFAVVDIDTRWVHKQTRERQDWIGRACKVYTLTKSRWYFIYQSGLLHYPSDA